jgi:hypothetical protein
MASDPIDAFLDQLKNRLTLEKGWIGLEPYPSIRLARLKYYRVFDESPTIVTVADARTSTETPTAIFEHLRPWFDVAVPRHGRGLLLLVYSGILAATDQHIRNARWYASPPLGTAEVERGWYDLSNSMHFLSAGDLEADLFGS